MKNKSATRIITSVQNGISKGKKPTVEYIQHAILNGASKRELLAIFEEISIKIPENPSRHSLSLKLARHWIETGKFEQ